jgi:DNA-binding CsgD family transcriptional regulator
MSKEERVFNEVKRLSYAGLDAPELRLQAALALRKAVPSLGFCLFEMDPASGIPVRLTEDPSDPVRARIMLQRVLFDGAYQEQQWMVQNHVIVRRLSDIPLERLEDDARYREIYRDMGWLHDLRSVFRAAGETWGGITLWRAAGDPDFTDEEVALVGRLAPHLGAGLRAAALRETAVVMETSGSGPGVLVIDDRGNLLQRNPAASRWLELLSEARAGDDQLPDAVWAVVGALRSALKTSSEASLTSSPLLRVRGNDGTWLTLQASAAESSVGRVNETVVVIEPAKPREVAWLRTAAYSLTPREQDVVDLVARGVATAEIARTLYISPYTVQDHLSNIFEKTGVRSRRELLKKLFLDQLGM